jgi:hypothetical protein
MKPLRLGYLLLLAGVAAFFLTTPGIHFKDSSKASAASSLRRLSNQQTALFFEQNNGQAEASVRFIAHGPQYDLLLRNSEIAFKSKTNSPGGEEVSLSFPGQDDKLVVQGKDHLPGVVNYYVGTDPDLWRSRIPTFAQVRYQNIFPGVDALFYGGNGGVEFDVQVAPGADPQQIRFKLSGPYALSGGDLLIGEQGWMRLQKPRAYQMVGGDKRDVSAEYVVTEGEVGVAVGQYDRSRSLVIDPVVLYQGYVPALGNGSIGDTEAVAADAAGNAYLLAQQFSSGTAPCLITKFSSAGALVYQTTYGAAAGLSCSAIAADAQANTYITGETSGGIPTTPGVVQPNYAGNDDAFAAKLSHTGQLVYGTYIGGSGSDSGDGIAVDTNGNAYLTGGTASNDFPLMNPFQSSLNGPSDAFVSVLNPTASAFVYSTYLGGSSYDRGYSIAVNGVGEAYVAGSTSSTDFPTKDPLYSCDNTYGIPFLSKFNSNGSALAYSTCLNAGPGGVMALDQNGNAFVAAGYDVGTVFFWGVSGSGTLNFSGSLSAPAHTLGVGVDAAGNFYIGAGGVGPNGNDPPGVVASYTNSGTQIYSIQTYSIGITSAAGAEAGNVYVSGYQQYANEPFFLVNTTQPPTGALISKISAQDAPALGYSSPLLAFGYQQIGVQSQPQTLELADLGSATLDLNSIVVSGPGFAPSQPITCGATLAAWATCNYSVTFTPLNGNPATGAITITDNSLGSPHVIQLTGQGAAPAVGLNPTSLSFPNTVVGQNSQPEVVTLTDTGHENLSISRISISGDFSETNDCGTGLGPGQKCSISVTFTPTGLGNRMGMVTISDSASNSPQTVPLSGTGINAGLDLEVAPDGSASATVQAGQTANYNLEIGGAGLSGVATLTCSGAPTGANCSLPSSMNVNGNTASPFTVSVTTTLRTMGQVLRPTDVRSRWLWATTLLGMMILPIGSCRKKRWLGRMRVLPIALLLLICSCGGGNSGSTSNSNGTPAGTYQLTVTAKSGATNQSIPLTLIVE